MAVKTIQYKGSMFPISYEIVNPIAHRDIIFLHGWGSNKKLMKHAFGEHLKIFRHIYIDMPGFGNSSCDTVISTEDYAAILDLFLQKITATKNIVVGHSYGGKVATLLKPDLLVLIASSGILVPKPLGVQAKIALFKLVKKLGAFPLVRRWFLAPDAKNLTPTMYEIFKHVVNEDFSPHFDGYQGRTLLCWGRHDSATPLWTAYTIAGLMGHADVVEYDGDHYFFLEQSLAVAKAIEKNFLDSLSA